MPDFGAAVCECRPVAGERIFSQFFQRVSPPRCLSFSAGSARGAAPQHATSARSLGGLCFFYPEWILDRADLGRTVSVDANTEADFSGESMVAACPGILRVSRGGGCSPADVGSAHPKIDGGLGASTDTRIGFGFQTELASSAMGAGRGDAILCRGSGVSAVVDDPASPVVFRPSDDCACRTHFRWIIAALFVQGRRGRVFAALGMDWILRRGNVDLALGLETQSHDGSGLPLLFFSNDSAPAGSI